jgi:Asp-tRNA(Asn)/Glu-tRNA(Gln) amidotransferase B subunit
MDGLPLLHALQELGPKFDSAVSVSRHGGWELRHKVEVKHVESQHFESIHIFIIRQRAVF